MNNENKMTLLRIVAVMLLIAIFVGFLISIATVLQGNNHDLVFFLKQWLRVSSVILCAEVAILGMGLSIAIPPFGIPVLIIGIIILCIIL